MAALDQRYSRGNSDNDGPKESRTYISSLKYGLFASVMIT